MVHFDETGDRVDGMLRGVHVACTPEVTLLHLAVGRSAESMSSGGILGHGFNGVAIHDGLPTYQKIRCLKRYVAREVFHVMKNPRPAPLTNDLRTVSLDSGWSGISWQSRCRSSTQES